MRSQPTLFLQNFLFGFLTFGVGFLLGLLFHQRLVPALVTGMITVPVGYMVTLWSEFRHLQTDRRQRNSLRYQIHLLQAQHQHLQQAVKTAIATQQEVNTNLQGLELDRDRLLSRITELHQYRNELIHELRQYQQEQAPTPYPQSLNMGSATPQAQQLEQYLQRLNDAIEAAQTDILDQQEALETVQQEVTRLTEEKATLLGQTTHLHQTLSTLQSRRDDLSDGIQALKTQQTELPTHLAALQQERASLQERLAVLQREHDTLMSQLTGLQQQHQDLSGQIQHQQAQLAIATQEYDTVQNQLQDALTTLTTTQDELAALEAQLAELQQPELPGRVYALAGEWYEFIQALSPIEKQALLAILDQDESRLKQLCQVAGREVPAMVEAFNETSIMTLGDLLLEFDPDSDLLTMQEDYAVVMSGSVAVLFRDLLVFGASGG